MSANKELGRFCCGMLPHKIYLRCVSSSLICGPQLLKVKFKNCKYWEVSRRKITILLYCNGSGELLDDEMSYECSANTVRGSCLGCCCLLLPAFLPARSLSLHHLPVAFCRLFRAQVTGLAEGNPTRVPSPYLGWQILRRTH